MKEKFRVVTYNIHKCKGLDWRTSPTRIADILREIDADIIALQEVVSATGAIGEENQSRFIAEQLGFDYAIGENRCLRGAAYGNVVLSRYPIGDAINFDITVRGREPRGCLQTDVKLGDDNRLHLYNLHLGTAFFERRKQVKRLLDAEILSRQHFAPPFVGFASVENLLGIFQIVRGIFNVILAFGLKLNREKLEEIMKYEI